MIKLPRISGKNLVSVLQKFGFIVLRVKGSHHILKHPDGRTTVVPIHKNETLGPGLLSKILKDCEISVSDLIREL